MMTLVTENEKPGIASSALLSDCVAGAYWCEISCSVERRRRLALRAKRASHVHPQKSPALCAGHWWW